ncbi:MAG: AbrB/MazE/SpoVT family DNA-binding domain-containing protein [Hyphomicrobiales bacterium]
MRVKIAKWGNSAAIRLPKAVIEQMRLVEGSEAELSVAKGELRLKAVPPVARLTRELLIASMDEVGLSGASETIDWGRDRGDEIIVDEYVNASTPLNNMGGKKRAF